MTGIACLSVTIVPAVPNINSTKRAKLVFQRVRLQLQRVTARKSLVLYYSFSISPTAEFVAIEEAMQREIKSL